MVATYTDAVEAMVRRGRNNNTSYPVALVSVETGIVLTVDDVPLILFHKETGMIRRFIVQETLDGIEFEALSNGGYVVRFDDE